MDIIKEIDKLPDYMKPNEITDWFKKVLDLSGSKLITKKETLSALFGLSDRQWHTYEVLNKKTKDDVEEWVIRNWEPTFEFIDRVAGVIGCLGLSKAYQKILDLKSNTELSPEIKSLVDEIIEEFGDSVENPFKV